MKPLRIIYTDERNVYPWRKVDRFIQKHRNRALVASKRFLFVIVSYIYIYILVAISRARYTVSSDVTWRVAQKTGGCQWLEISIISRADILQIPE